jgi:formate--tetrahydrofolate ligase
MRTGQEKDGTVMTGWGMFLEKYVDARVMNLAASGDWAKKWFENSFSVIEKEGEKGDIFVIQFGINDRNRDDKTHDTMKNALKDMIAKAESKGIKAIVCKGFEKGGDGAIELAEEVVALADSGKADFTPLYSFDMPIKEKIEKVAKEIYGAESVNFDAAALKTIKEAEELGFGNYPVCMAKTQYSLSDDMKALGRPTGFTLNVREVRISSGAGFIVALTGAIMTMPGLPKKPAAVEIDIDNNGTISGLF